MSLLSQARERLRALVSRSREERGLAEELRFHIEMETEANLRRGMGREEARRQALIALGGIERTKEEVRKARSLGLLEDLLQDLCYATRRLVREPAFSVPVIATLALGLGANFAIFTFLDSMFLRPPAGVEKPGQVRRPWTEIQFRSGPQFWPGYSYPQYAAIQSAVSDRVHTALYLYPRDTRFGPAEEDHQVRVSWASASYFPLLGVRPEVGRLFTNEEDQLGAGANVAVASEAFWRRQFDGDPGALGREVLLAGIPYVLIGVAAAEFSGVDIDATDLWVPLASQPGRGATPWWQNHNVNGFQILLRPLVAIEDRTLEERIAAALRTPDALMRPADTAKAVRLGSIIRAQGPGKRQQEVKIATRLAGVTIIVLIIACANVVNLLLARAVRRRREVAVRLAMGISRARLARLLLTETALLAMVAAAAAVLAAAWGGALLRGLLLPEVRWASSPLHWRIVGLAAITGMGAGVLAGLLPAMQATKTELTGALKAGGADGHARRSRVRATLVVVQAALSMVLLVGAGLFVRSLANIGELRIGFDVPQVIFGAVAFDSRDSIRDARLPQALTEVAERLRHAPGVERVALARTAPTRGFSSMPFYPDVDTTLIPKRFATYNLVSADFFAATGLRLLRGTNFPASTGGGMPPAVIVNEAMARAQWPGMDAVGRCLRFEPNGQCYGVVGIVETALFDRLIEEPSPQFYLPLENPPPQAGRWFSSLIVRAQPRARGVASTELQRALREAFPGGRPSLMTMEQALEPEYRPWRLGATLFTAFGVLALIVAALGIYSTVAYTVAQRTHEFGVRTALGARHRDILREVIGSMLRTTAIGVAAGVGLALAGGKFVAALLYGIKPTDPGVMVGVAFALFLIGAGAALGPAWRAARVDPVAALRTE